MNPEQVSGSGSGDPARFRTTRWTEILAAAETRMPGSQEALAELCRLYWYPLYAFARRRGSGPHDAQDLTQDFFLHLLENRSLKQENFDSSFPQTVLGDSASRDQPHCL